MRVRENQVQKISAWYPCWSVLKSIPPFLLVGSVLQWENLGRLLPCLLGLLVSSWLWPVGNPGGTYGRVRKNSQCLFPSHSTLGHVCSSSCISSEAPSPTNQPLHSLSFYWANCAVAQALARWLSLLHSSNVTSPIMSPSFLQLLFFRLPLHPVWLLNTSYWMATSLYRIYTVEMPKVVTNRVSNAVFKVLYLLNEYKTIFSI